MKSHMIFAISMLVLDWVALNIVVDFMAHQNPNNLLVQRQVTMHTTAKYILLSKFGVAGLAIIFANGVYRDMCVQPRRPRRVPAYDCTQNLDIA